MLSGTWLTALDLRQQLAVAFSGMTSGGPRRFHGLCGRDRTGNFAGCLKKPKQLTAPRLPGSGRSAGTIKPGGPSSSPRGSAWTWMSRKRLGACTRRPGTCAGSPRPALVGKILEGALTLAGADRGNVQLLDPATGSRPTATSRPLPPFARPVDTPHRVGRSPARRGLHPLSATLFPVSLRPGDHQALWRAGRPDHG